MPLWARYINRILWECLRFTLPLLPFTLLLGWFSLLSLADDWVSLPVLILGVVPVLDFGVLAALAYGKEWQAKERKIHAAV